MQIQPLGTSGKAYAYNNICMHAHLVTWCLCSGTPGWPLAVGSAMGSSSTVSQLRAGISFFVGLSCGN